MSTVRNAPDQKDSPEGGQVTESLESSLQAEKAVCFRFKPPP